MNETAVEERDRPGLVCTPSLISRAYRGKGIFWAGRTGFCLASGCIYYYYANKCDGETEH